MDTSLVKAKGAEGKPHNIQTLKVHDSVTWKREKR